MHFTRFFSEQKEELSLVLDIQSENVSGALVQFSDKTQPTILAFEKDDVAFRKNTDAKFLNKAMAASLDAVLAKLIHVRLTRLNQAQGSSKRIDSVHVLLASPWSLSQSKTIKLSYDKPTKVSKADIDKILSDQRKTMEADYRKNSEESKADYDVTFFEQKVLDIKCNGYSVKNIDSIMAQDISVAFVTSITSASFIDGIRRSIHKYAHIRREYIHSSILLEYTALRDVYHSMNEYVMVRPLGELTDVIVIKDGTCVNIASFPSGSHTIARKLARKLELATHSAYIYLKAGNAKSDVRLDAKFEQQVTNIIKSWETMCLETMKIVEAATTLPRTWFLFGTESKETFSKALNDVAQKVHEGGAGYSIQVPSIEELRKEVVTASGSGPISDRMYLHIRSLDHLLN